MRELIPGLTLDIDTDRLAARLAIVANVEAVDSPTIIAALEGEGITRTQIDEEAIAVALAAARAGPHDAEPTEAVVARGTPVHHGRNARVDIEPALAEQLDRQRAVLSKTAGEAERAKVCDEADVSHYEVNALCVVAPGQRIGRALDAAPGDDGLDIFGKVVGAREGREIALKLDGAARDGAGVITAKHAGLLLIDPTHVTVSKELRLPGAVDFTTGHVRFPGDAEIADGVRDNFRVEVGGTITVRNLVEAATLKSGVDIILERGMAARNKGRIDAGRDLSARYLDSVTGTVGRDLIVENEITGCDIAVARRVISPKATMVSGLIRAADSVELAEVGSAARAQAGVLAGTSPKVEQTARSLLALAPRVLADVAAAQERLKTLRSIGGKMSPAQAEELTELEFAVASGQGRMEPIARAMLRAGEVLESCRRAGVIVQGTIHAGSKVSVAGVEAIIKRSLEGPITVAADDQGTALVRDQRTGSAVELSSVAEVGALEGSVDLAAVRAAVDELSPGLAERVEAERAKAGKVICGDAGAKIAA